MAMKPQTIRFSDTAWQLIARQAQREGVTTAQYVREAAMMRAAYEMARHRGTDARTVDGVLKVIRHALRAAGLP
jgi:hypothetical protein